MTKISFDYTQGRVESTVSAPDGTVISVPFKFDTWRAIQVLFWAESMSPQAIARYTGYSEPVVRVILKRMPRLIVTNY